MALKHGVVLPGGTAPEQLELAVLAEEAGWDGVFVWEAGYGVDPWGLLCAMAARTSRVRLGTLLTPLPWRRPWKVASQVATLDQLSGGRAVLSVGVGAVDPALPDTGEVTGLPQRAAMLGEGIDLIRTLWAGGRSHHGEHYHYETTSGDFGAAARPVQERIPIWVVAVWPRPRSLRRALRCDGVIPMGAPDPAALRELRGWLTEHGAGDGFDLLTEGETPAGGSAEIVAPWAEAGATWWMETRWGKAGEIRARIEAGP